MNIELWALHNKIDTMERDLNVFHNVPDSDRAQYIQDIDKVKRRVKSLELTQISKYGRV